MRRNELNHDKWGILIKLTAILFFVLFIGIKWVGAQTIEHPEWGFQDFSAETVYHVTDLTSANIQAAIDQASSNGGGTVLLAPGTGYLDSRIDMKSNVKLKGELNSDGSWAVTIIAQSEFDEGFIYAHGGTSNFTIEDMIIDAGGFDHHAIAPIYGPDNWMVSHCKILNAGYPKVDCSPDDDIYNSHANNLSGIAVWSSGDPADHWTVQNCVIMNYAKHGVAVHNASHYIIKNNYFRNGFMGYDSGLGTTYGEMAGNEVVDVIFGCKLVNEDSHDMDFHDNNFHHMDPSPYRDPGYGEDGWSHDSGSALILFNEGYNNTVVKNNILSGISEDQGIVFWNGATPEGYDLINNDTTPTTGEAPPYEEGNTAPNITNQPQSQTKDEGETATFSVTATGTAPLSYQWYLNGSDISGATSSSFTTSSLTMSDDGNEYYCIVTNDYGSATSNTATLTVNSNNNPPQITAQPQSQTKTVGSSATFSVTATGTAPLSYQWYMNDTEISGATESSYTTPALTMSDDGSTYHCVVTNSAGSATSDNAVLTVTESSGSSSITIDGDMNDWDASMQFDVDPNQVESTGEDINVSLDLKDIYVTNDNDYLYVRIDINEAGHLSDLNSMVDGDGNQALIELYFDTDLSNTTGLTWGVWENGADYYLNITDADGNPGLEVSQAYGILKYNNGDGSWTEVSGYSCQVAKNSADNKIEVAIPRAAIGETAEEGEATGIMVESEDPTDNWKNDYSPDDVGNVRNVYNYVANSTTSQAPQITDQPQSQTKTEGETATFSVTASGTNPLSYQWYVNDAQISGATEASYTTPALTMSDDGSTYHCVVTNSAGSATSDNANLTVNESSGADTISMTIDKQEQENNDSGVEVISELDNISSSVTAIGTGQMIDGWDVDQYYFTVQEAGTIEMILDAPQEMTLKAGSEAGGQDFFRSEDKTHHDESFDVDAGQTIYLSMFDWETGDGYEYTLTIVYSTGQLGKKNAKDTEENWIKVPDKYKMAQNYPNPFNPLTTIQYGLPEDSYVEITVYDIKGIKVATLVNSFQQAGFKKVVFDASNLSSGLYFYKIKAGKYENIKRMLLVK